MTEQKRNRLAAAITVNVILLIVVLAAVLVYQLVVMSLGKSKRSYLESEIARYEQMKNDAQSDLERLQAEQGILDILFKEGYVFKEN